MKQTFCGVTEYHIVDKYVQCLAATVSESQAVNVKHNINMDS